MTSLEQENTQIATPDTIQALSAVFDLLAKFDFEDQKTLVVPDACQEVLS